MAWVSILFLTRYYKFNRTQNTEAMRALRRRILLDAARRLILLTWAPNNPDPRWHEFRAQYNTHAEVQQFIESRNIFPRPLTTEALDRVLAPKSNIRAAGNNVAHKSTKDLIKEAIEHADSPHDVHILSAIWESVYDQRLEWGT